MRHVLFVFLVVAAILIATQAGAAPPAPGPSPAAPAPSPSPTLVLVPKGTLIIVQTTRSYKSYGASSGTKVTYEVAQDAIVNGYLIAQAGDSAEGQILNAHEGTTNWFTGEHKGANLRVSVDKLYNFCGDTIEIDFARSEFRNKEGLFGGKQDVEISKGQKYQVPTQRAQRICATQTSATPAPIPSDALEGDKT